MPEQVITLLLGDMADLMGITGEPENASQRSKLQSRITKTELLSIYVQLKRRGSPLRLEKVKRDLSLLDVQVAGLANQGMNYLLTEKSPVRMGNTHPCVRIRRLRQKTKIYHCLWQR